MSPKTHTERNPKAAHKAKKWNKKAESGSKKIRYVSVGVAGVKKGKKKYEKTTTVVQVITNKKRNKST